MRQYLTNLLLIVCMVLTVNGLGNYLFPNTQGDAAIERKKSEAFQNAGEHDPIFMGSSRTFRHIDPLLFDSLLEQSHGGKTSYNLGVPATFVPEMLFCYEQIMSGLENGPSTIIMELQEINLLALKNLSSLKGTYWITNEYLLFSIKALWQSQKPMVQKVVGSGIFVAGWSVNHFGFNYLTVAKPEKDGRESLEVNGFVCLQESMADKQNARDLWKRRNDYLKDTLQLEVRADRQRKVQAALLEGKQPHVNSTLLKKINDLIRLSADKGIDLIFILPPRLPNYKTVLPLGQAIPEGHFVDLSSPDRHPELWMAEQSFDVAHMNCNGASFYTKALIKELSSSNMVLE